MLSFASLSVHRQQQKRTDPPFDEHWKSKESSWGWSPDSAKGSVVNDDLNIMCLTAMPGGVVRNIRLPKTKVDYCIEPITYNIRLLRAYGLSLIFSLRWYQLMLIAINHRTINIESLLIISEFWWPQIPSWRPWHDVNRIVAHHNMNAISVSTNMIKFDTIACTS